MLFQMQNESGFFICAGFGWILLTGYALFAIYVTRYGDYYKIRRWKTAIWISIMSAVLVLVIIIVYFEGAIVINSLLFQNPGLLFGTKVDYIFHLFRSIIDLLLIFPLFLTPYLFMFTIGEYYQLKWWLTSDDYLDKVWKDPNRPNRSPIQWL
jgi:hypothetical protein